MHFATVVGRFQESHADVASLIASRPGAQLRPTAGLGCVIADGLFGRGNHEWDLPEHAWSYSDYNDVFSIAKSVNITLEGTVFVFFVDHTQLAAVLRAIAEEEMSYREVIWEKVSRNFAKGPRWRQGHETAIVAWRGPESRAVAHIDGLDQGRYNTVHRQGSLKPSSFIRVPGTQHPLNKYQKPILLMRKFVAAFTSPGDLILDVTCGTGTTAVSIALRCACVFLQLLLAFLIHQLCVFCFPLRYCVL